MSSHLDTAPDVQPPAEQTDGSAAAELEKPLGDALAKEELLDDEYEYGDAYDYRTLSVAAVASLILGLISIPAVLVPTLLVIPAVGTGLGIFAVWTVTTRPDEFTGRRLAVTGLGLSALMFVGGTAGHWYFDRIEVPERYLGKEISFWDLQPEQEIDMQHFLRARNRNIELPLPEKAKEMDGQEVFVTGYVYPGAQRDDLKKFVLVPDMKTCCFGGQPKLTDMIEVTLEDPLRADFSYRRRGLGGVLRVHKTLQSREQLTGVVYQLEADYLSP